MRTLVTAAQCCGKRRPLSVLAWSNVKAICATKLYTNGRVRSIVTDAVVKDGGACNIQLPIHSSRRFHSQSSIYTPLTSLQQPLLRRFSLFDHIPKVTGIIGDPHVDDKDRLTVALDLDDTLIHSEIYAESQILQAIELEKERKLKALKAEHQRLKELGKPVKKLTSSLFRRRKVDKVILPGEYDFNDPSSIDIDNPPHRDGPYRFNKLLLTSEGLKKRHQFAYDITFVIPEKGRQPALRVFVLFRPHLASVLLELCHRFEPLLFASGTPEYVDPIANYIEKYLLPKEEDSLKTDRTKIGYRQPGFRFRLYRHHTVKWKHYTFCKDIRRFGRDMRQVVIVDDNFTTMYPTPDNAIPLPPFTKLEDMGAESLPGLIKLLQDVTRMMETPYGVHNAPMHDVRRVLSTIVNFREMARKHDRSVKFDPI